MTDPADALMAALEPESEWFKVGAGRSPNAKAMYHNEVRAELRPLAEALIAENRLLQENLAALVSALRDAHVEAEALIADRDRLREALDHERMYAAHRPFCWWGRSDHREPCNCGYDPGAPIEAALGATEETPQ